MSSHMRDAEMQITWAQGDLHEAENHLISVVVMYFMERKC